MSDLKYFFLDRKKYSTTEKTKTNNHIQNMLIFSVVCFEHLSVKRNVWLKNLAPKISMKFIAVSLFNL